MQIKELVNFLDHYFPKELQEDYDNSGFQLGDDEQPLKGVLTCVDVTEKVLDEALENGDNFILSHHPLIFSGLKSLTGKNYVERIVMKAIQHNIAIYSAHTNLDNSGKGVNVKLAEKMGLKDLEILKPMKDQLIKLVFFVPNADADKVREAVFSAGAGKIGDYDACSYNLKGQGSFRAGEGTNPYVGEKGELHFEDETRVETIFPKYLTSEVLSALFSAHPYEEVAYDLYPLKNLYAEEGAGIIGFLPEAMEEKDFLNFVKTSFDAQSIRHTDFLGNKIQKVAIGGGSGSFLLKDALNAKADVLISADFKYHNFFDADGSILIADIGHYESEKITKEIFYEVLTEKFHNFAIHFSKINTNPINYY
jgi:dinuclear metal center YbgI/SA1388 family protein